MGYNNRILGAMLLTIILAGCSNAIPTETAFLKWLDDPGNGCVKATSANGFTLSLKYLPPEYLAYMESGKGEGDTSDLLGEFDGAMTLLFTVAHDPGQVDVANYKVLNMATYRERANLLNFELRDHLYIKGSNGERISPVLTTYENSYEVVGKKKFYVVFPKKRIDGLGGNVVDVVFDDPFLDTGINHFRFKRSALEQIPILQFIN